MELDDQQWTEEYIKALARADFGKLAEVVSQCQADEEEKEERCTGGSPFVHFL